MWYAAGPNTTQCGHYCVEAASTLEYDVSIGYALNSDMAMFSKNAMGTFIQGLIYCPGHNSQRENM